MAMVQRQARIIGNEIYLHALAARHVDRVLENSRGRLFADASQLKRMTVKVDRMIVAALVFHTDSVTLPFLYDQRIDIRPGVAVDRPSIKTAVAAENFFKDQINALIWFGMGCVSTENCIIPIT